jgi:hypothetical protein
MEESICYDDVVLQSQHGVGVKSDDLGLHNGDLRLSELLKKHSDVLVGCNMELLTGLS